MRTCICDGCGKEIWDGHYEIETPNVTYRKDLCGKCMKKVSDIVNYTIDLRIKNAKNKKEKDNLMLRLWTQ